jgi:membrane protease YdiL (CAAX protease family)
MPRILRCFLRQLPAFYTISEEARGFNLADRAGKRRKTPPAASFRRDKAGKAMRGKREESTPPAPRGKILALAVVFEGGLVVLWLLLALLLDIRPGEQGRATWAALMQGVAGTLPLLPFLWWLSRSPLRPVRRMMKEVDEVLVPLLSRLSVADYALIALLAGIGEEGVFRGIVQESLGSAVSQPAAVLGASVVFGLLHFITPAYAVLAGVLGAYLGVLYVLTGNLLVPITVHFLYDFCALLYLVRWRGGAALTRGRGVR